MRMNSDALMLAGSAWKCVIMDFLFFYFNNRAKGQIPELHYLKLFLKKERERDSCRSGAGVKSAQTMGSS